MISRHRWTAASAMLLICGTAGGAHAQTPPGGGSSRLDIGIYAGGTWSSDWFHSRGVTTDRGVITELEGERRFGIGVNPIFGGGVTLWATPALGFRIHGAMLPSGIPTERGESLGFFERSPRPLNNYLYDLNLMLRPFSGRLGMSPLMGSTYMFVGGGGFTASLAGPPPGCEPTLVRAGACLPYDHRHATVGQGTVGIGIDILPLGQSLGLFAEIAGHGYSAPVHVDDGFLPRVTVRTGQRVEVADKQFAVTPRAVAGLKLALGGAAPVAVPAPPPAAPPMPPPPTAPASRELSICVVDGGQLRTVTAMFNPATNDTTVAGQAFSAQHRAAAPDYAAGANWFVQSDELMHQNRAYVKFGTTRIIQPAQLQRAGEHQGTPLFTETSATMPHSVVYVPIRPGCEFQPYQLRETIRPRG